MNVFYIGVANPVDISASGVAKDQLNVSISNGSISKSKDGWEVNVKKPGKAVVNVAAKVDGRSKTMGSMEFRVKRIPTPVPEVAGKTSGAVNKGKLAASLGIVAKMENFEFDVRVVVDSYMFTYVAANGLTQEERVSGPRFNDAVKQALRNLRPGSRVTFESIMAKMPDGELQDFILAAKQVAKVLEDYYPDVGRVGLIMEGTGIDHAHIKLVPMHGTEHMKTGEWKQYLSDVEQWFDTYEGWISSAGGPMADRNKLIEASKKIRNSHTR
jgi:diadenosine tetraphosphate (Ap4A) HIT family hydrolase